MAVEVKGKSYPSAIVFLILLFVVQSGGLQWDTLSDPLERGISSDYFEDPLAEEDSCDEEDYTTSGDFVHCSSSILSCSRPFLLAREPRDQSALFLLKHSLLI